MIKRDELITFIYKTIGHDLLEKAREKDELANGVQFYGHDEVEVVTLGVSLNEEFLQKAVNDKSNFCIFHHGFDPRTYKSCYGVSSQKRLRLIINNNITVMGFHYALDAHLKIGNNAQIINKLGAKLEKPLYEQWGYVGTYLKPQNIKKLRGKCEDLFGREILHINSGQEMIRTIGVVSGAGKPYQENIYELKKKKVQLYISGETSESRVHILKETGVDYFVCGHYSTEVFGVKALGENIKKQFKDKVVVEFIDVPNPI